MQDPPEVPNQTYRPQHGVLRDSARSVPVRGSHSGRSQSGEDEAGPIRLVSLRHLSEASDPAAIFPCIARSLATKLKGTLVGYSLPKRSVMLSFALRQPVNLTRLVIEPIVRDVSVSVSEGALSVRVVMFMEPGGNAKRSVLRWAQGRDAVSTLLQDPHNSSSLYNTKKRVFKELKLVTSHLCMPYVVQHPEFTVWVQALGEDKGMSIYLGASIGMLHSEGEETDDEAPMPPNKRAKR